MSTRVQCPHCQTPCMVAREHLGAPVRCSQCRNTFTVRPAVAVPAAPAPGVQPVAPPARPTAVHAGPPRLGLGASTSPGRVRDRNEDSFLAQHLTWSNADRRHELALVVVADGMGAYQGGDRASGVVIRAVGETLSSLLCGALTGQFQDLDDPLLADPLAHALQQANKAVYHKAQVEPSCKGMGATAAVVLVWDSEVRIAHVGDCRVYHHHAGKLTQVTSDQTLVARMVELGTLTPEEAKTHPSRNEVTHAVGKYPTLEPARHRLRLAPGDWLVVCCDGLYAHVDDPTLQALLGPPAPSSAHLAQQLVDLANQGGGTDNCTVVTLHRV